MSLNFNVPGFVLTAPALVFLVKKRNPTAIHGIDFLVGRAEDHLTNAFIAQWKFKINRLAPTTKELEQLAKDNRVEWEEQLKNQARKSIRQKAQNDQENIAPMSLQLDMLSRAVGILIQAYRTSKPLTPSEDTQLDNIMAQWALIQAVHTKADTDVNAI